MVHLADTRVSETLSGQYGIRDIMIAMSVAALIMATIKFFGSQSYTQDWSRILTAFGLITVSFFLLSWPVVVTCLSERWLLLTVFSVILIAGIYLAQQPVFSSILGPSGDFKFFLFLDAPFVLVVVLHSLIARGFGYRLKAMV